MTATSKIFYWLPRILSILFIAFISIFALDVFGQPQWFLALIIHLIPSFFLIFFTVIAWKFEKLGGILFIAIGIALLFITNFEGLILYIPAFVIGALYLYKGFLTAKLS
jgi:hypothetical protein